MGGPGRTTDVYVVNADGGDIRQLTVTAECEDTPTWSPDGQQIVAASKLDCEDDATSSLVVLNSDGSGEPKPIVESPALWPDWSADGPHLVYVGANSVRDDPLIFVSHADGTDAPLDLPGINSPTEPT